MSSLKRITAGASALVLASSAALVGGGVAGAQGSSEIVAELQLGATALNGPVQVVGDGDGGPKVSFTNESNAAVSCVGFTLPYTTVDELGFDPAGIDLSDLGAALALIAQIEGEGGVALLSATDGEPSSYLDPAPAPDNTAVVILASGLIGGPAGVGVAPGASVTWDAAGPEVPAAAAVLCVPDASVGGDRVADLDINFGIDKQVIVDQINDRLGPLGSLTSGSVSGGSVGAGASLLGSLGGGDDAGDDNGEEAGGGSAAAISGVSEAGVGSQTGELPAMAPGA